MTANSVWRLSDLFGRTLREDPADVEADNHRLLVRAGYLRRLAPGVHAWLPLGRRVLGALEQSMRADLVQLGGLEIGVPVSVPDRFDAVAGLLRSDLASYRDLPLTLFQLQTVLRPRPRPRGGLLEAREYRVVESWSLDADADGLQSAYNRHRALFMRALDRLEVEYRIVAASTGGGGHAEQFLAVTPAGEDPFVTCGGCDYAAIAAAVRRRVPSTDGAASLTGPAPAPEEISTPDAPTIEALAARLGVTPAQTLKNLLMMATAPDGSREVVAVGVPGDREVDLQRVEKALAPARVELFDEADFAAHPHLIRGYVGPQGMAGRKFRYLADLRVQPGTVWVTGANAVGRHTRNLVAGRDFVPDRYADLVQVRDDDPCPACGGRLRLHRGVAVARIARLGSSAARLDVLGRDGRSVRVACGAYALGMTRVIGAVVEQHHDAAGLCWPRAAAPADVHIVVAGRDPRVLAGAEALGAAVAADFRVLLDDRAVSAGVKFADAELIGLPVILVVGRGLASGTVEMRERRSGRRCEVAVGAVLPAVRTLLGGGHETGSG